MKEADSFNENLQINQSHVALRQGISICSSSDFELPLADVAFLPQTISRFITLNNVAAVQMDSFAT